MRHRLAIRVVAALVFATILAPPARALGPADLLPDLHGLLRWFWAQVGSDLDPSGHTAPIPLPQVGSSLDPSGHRLWGEVGSDLDPSGRSAPPPSQEGSDLDPNGARQEGSSLDPNG